MEVLKIGTQTRSNDTKDKIIHLFYEKHKRTTDISKKLKISMPYVTKIIQKDNRYIEEKQERKDISNENQKDLKRRYIRKRRENERQEYLAMQRQIDKDNEFLSSKVELSDVKYAKWNRSVFRYDKNSSDLVLKKGINAGYNAPKRVRDIINPNCIKATS